MKIIIKNGDNFILSHIPENELELVKKNNELVITDFIITKEQEKVIMGGVSFSYTDKIVLGDKTEYLKRQKQEEAQKQSEQKAKSIIDLLGADDKLDAVIKQINIINKSLIEKGSANKELTEVVNGINTILTK